MGCEQSKLSKTAPMPVSIVDSHFLKPENSPLLILLEKHNIQPHVFMSIDCLLDSLALNYTHNIILREVDYQKATTQLGKAKLQPRVFVLGNKKEGNMMGKRVFFFEKYEDLPQILNKHETQQAVQKQARSVDVQILQDFKRQASQFFIFQQTLKKQAITYQLHNSFSELQASHTTSPFLVVDYRFHRAAVALRPKSKVICYCDLSEEETYDPQTFFITSNFQQIVNEILIFKQLTQPVLPISKIFLCSHSPHLLPYAQIFQNFALKVRAYSSISELIKKTRLYFSVMVVCPQEEAAQMQKKIQEEGCAFRMRILAIPPNTQCSAVGLRRILRQVKRGYLVQRGPSKAVDIIDKYHSSSKFEEIKRELTSKGIAFKCYNNITSYCKTLTFISPVIICNFDDRLLLHRFLNEVQIKAKVIIFCNRSKITEQLTRDTRWSFVSSHFGKIIKCIKTHHVLLPKFLEQTPKKIDAKKKEHRISAVKWAQQSNSHNNSHQQFVLKDNNDLGTQCASRLKMATNPIQSFQTFRKNLIQAVSALRSQFKLNILDSDFTSMVNELSQSNLMQLMLRTRRFLSDQKDMGIGLNSVLLKCGNQEQVKNAKEAIFLLCFNFIGIYQIPFSESVRLSCWSQQDTLKQCSPGNTILCRNFLVMRQQFAEERLPGCVKLQMELQYSAVKQLSNPPFFVFQGRYVFAPHSQFQVTKIEGEGDARVLHIQFLPQNTFLSQFFEQNISKDIVSTFKQQLAKPQTPLISPQHKQHLLTNLARIQAYKHCQTNISKSIQIQRQLIRLEQENDNFDSRLLTELKYQLAVYLSLEDESSEQLMDLISEIKDSSPSPFIKQQCAAMLGQLQGVLSNRKEKAKTIKCIQLKQQIQKDSQDQQDPIEQQHCIQYDTFFQCLQLEQKEGLAQQFS